MPTQQLPGYLIPLAAELGVRPYYGDIHNHCDLSYGHGSLTSALHRAKQQLDFVSITGHAYWPDMPIDDPSVAHIVDFHIKGFAKLEKNWPEHFATLSRFHQSGQFTVFPGYEMHSCEHGDYTIVLRDLNQCAIVKGDSPAELLNRLVSVYGDRALAFPHHIGYRTGARGINWETFNETLSPAVELISMHGCSETSLTDKPFLHSMGPCDGANTIHNGWNNGHVFGVLGNTDHHSGYPGSYGHGRSCVYASENSPAELWQAIHIRHTSALTGDNCHLFAKLGNATAGDIVSPTTNAVVDVEAIGGSFIDYIDIVKNSKVIKRITPAITPCSVGVYDSVLDTILVLELGWGERHKSHDWTGNISLRHGEILAVEPRLRGPEVVSPLDGEAREHHDRIECIDGQVDFAIRAFANPNNATSATQSIALRVRLEPDATIVADLCGQRIDIKAERLRAGALSGNLGTIDTPAFRFHPLPQPEQWQWMGRLEVGPLQTGDWLSLRMRQTNSQWAWSSAFFCR
ncbi:MAG: hypothetical protein ACJAZF_003912 [Granulosicoccus sp.]|jgi:hypothetical protein